MQRLGVTLVGMLALACTPRVQIEAPKDPIVINLNVKIEQEVRVRIDRELEDLFQERGDLFGAAAGDTKETQ